jgi:hypothetical protein
MLARTVGPAQDLTRMQWWPKTAQNFERYWPDEVVRLEERWPGFSSLIIHALYDADAYMTQFVDATIRAGEIHVDEQMAPRPDDEYTTRIRDKYLEGVYTHTMRETQTELGRVLSDSIIEKLAEGDNSVLRVSCSPLTINAELMKKQIVVAVVTLQPLNRAHMMFHFVFGMK